MSQEEELGAVVEFEAVRFAGGDRSPEVVHVPSEVPLTVEANGVEVATLLCTPTEIPSLVLGFLFSAGVVRGPEELREWSVDPTRWKVECAVARTPDVELLGKRVYTSGCGKGVMFATVAELAGRRPLESPLRVPASRIDDLARALQGASPHYRRTRGIHTGAVSLEGELPERWFDDVGRHNAVDKAIGDALFRGVDLARCILLSSGRTSSEVLHKARRAGIPVVLSRSVPTHQSVLRARDMGITLLGRAKGAGFLAYAHAERIVPNGASAER
ncbi:formate dehydrogenase accessory sulfurtransferase FdhD [Deferrisoma palaeochoriense]